MDSEITYALRKINERIDALEKNSGTGNGPEVQQGPCKRSTE